MRLLFLPLFLLFSFFAIAQHNLSSGPNGSIHTYVYKITTEEAAKLFTANMQKISDAYLHTLVDSFQKEEPGLLPGNYLFAKAVHNKLVFELKSAGDVSFKAINNNRDLVIALHTKQGDLITDAEVFINKKLMQYDASTQTFRRDKYKKNGLLKVYHKNVVYAFAVEPVKYGTYHQSFWKKLGQSFPLRYIVNPVSKLFKSEDNGYRSFFYETTYEKGFRGFMVCSKPKYKPGDTVKLKAFVASKSGKPLEEKLLLRLSNRGLDIDTIITTLSPYRNGGYEYNFVLSDSLDMDLDEEYVMTLEEERSKKYNLNEEEEYDDEEAFAAKRKVVMRGRFYFEEYELNTIQFAARSDKKEHNRGEEIAIYAKASDENDMAVMDGRIQLIVKPSQYGNKSFGTEKVFIADTLWQHEQAMEALGETKVLLPDSIFLQASFLYNVECIFLNSNNERQTKTLNLNFYYKVQRLHFTQEGDSLRIALIEKGKSVSAKAQLYAFNEKDDTISKGQILLPATIKPHPFAEKYEVETDSLDEEYKMQYNRGIVSALASRTKDSVFIQLVNPYRLPVWYTVFAGNKILFRGKADNLAYADKVRTAKNYFVSLQYIYNGSVRNEDFTIPYQDRLLSVKFIQPDVVYPGQKTDISIDVKDAEGKPVADADVTAWAFTKKFQNVRTPFVPYLGKFYPGRKRYSTFKEEEKEYENSIRLAWQRWSKEMHLDTMEYYKFLRPQTFYINKEAAPDSLTQIAPFIVKDGELQPVHHIYIDEVPVFFSAAQQLKRYSFPVSPGKHSFRIRTHNSLISLDSFYVTKGVKTFLSINADESNQHIRIQKMPETLTVYEKSLWSKYMLLVENNFGEKYASIKSWNNVYLLNPSSHNNATLTGPLPDSYAQIEVKNGFTQNFGAEGGYQYQFSKGLIKQKLLHNPDPFSLFLSNNEPSYSFSDIVLTENEIDSLWQLYLYNRSASEELFRNAMLMKKDNGELHIGIIRDSLHKEPFIRHVFLFKYDDPDFLRIYKGQARNLGFVQPGKYRVLLLLKDDKYFIKDSIFVKKDGINYYEIGTIIPKEKDSVSLRISAIINQREKAYWYGENTQDFDSIKESFNERYFNASLFTETISGIVRDDQGNPVVGASVITKGTRSGTATDRFGRFTLKTLPNSVLVVNSVGYASQEIKVSGNRDYSFSLSASKQNLSEVVVVGYGTSRRMELAGSVSSVMANSLQGKVAGVFIRGAGTMDGNSNPLIIVDGIPFSGKMEDLDASIITSVDVLKDEKAKALYGSRGAGGVIIISTKKAGLNNTAIDNVQAANSLRRNFRDDGWWQPKLKTNAEGRASFTAIYPDDITAWRTFAIAMTDNKQSGYAESVVRSFKAISGNITMPQFAVEGDSITLIGKALNYMTDSISTKRSFYINDRLIKEDALHFRNAWIDSFSVTATHNDSLKLKYTVQKTDGYFDGEERSIPVFKQGVLEAKGFFSALRGDTSFTIKPVSDTGTIKLYAETSVLPSLEKEVEYLRNYEYLCNEQLASKLKGLLVQKRIDGYLNRPFKYNKAVNEMIAKLSQSKNGSGLWGWWAGNEPTMWISLHVLEALLQARVEGYPVSLNNAMLIDYLIYNVENYKDTERLTALSLLQLLGAKADYKRYTDSLQMQLFTMSLYEKLRLAEIKQKAGLEFYPDSLVIKQSRTTLGNIYWGEESYRFFDNSIQNTIIMYRLLKAKGGQKDLLEKTRGYFLERRHPGHWRNTYESSLILETVLPDLLINDSLSKPSSLTINASETISRFPFTKEIKGGQPITISKQGAWPVYFTAYEQYWNNKPQKVTGDFTVTSTFEKAGEPITKLKGGQPVLLKVAVTIKADANYVMVEVPIPAGCSYNDKRQSNANNEVHREYFKNKVSIFCSSLKKGDYVFTVSLLPRYSGKYTLNPAKAELMYFPVFYGREEMKKVTVQ